jgi:alpha-ketoglutarate-dependent taurine dioxygenase
MIKKTSFYIIIVAIIFSIIPLEWMTPNFLKLDVNYKPAMFFDNMIQYDGKPLTEFKGNIPKLEIAPKGFLLVITSQTNKDNVTINDFLTWYSDNKELLDHLTNEYGGILFRNFPIKTPIDFDNMIENLHPDIQAEIYLGTTPRYRINGTKYIQSASEAPKLISIPTHIELSFSKQPPKRIYFYADTINPAPGGHTPLTDFRGVWDDIPLSLKNNMINRGLVYERWYRDESNRPFDPLVHKSWQSMFLTDNKTIAKEMSAAQGYDATWDDNNDLLLKHKAVISRTHSITKREFWCTHYNVLHASTYAIPYAWDAQLLQSKLSMSIALFLHYYINFRHNILGLHYGSNTLYADDESDFTWDDAVLIRKIIANNTWMFPYEKDDVIMLDNHRLAHGRTPWYKGKRSVMVAYH